MTGKERVSSAFEFHVPDRIPLRWGCFWDEFTLIFQARFPGTDLMTHFGNDMDVVAADETTWPTCAGIIKENADERIVRDGWVKIMRDTI